MSKLRCGRRLPLAGLFLAIGMCLIFFPAESAGTRPGEVDRALIAAAQNGHAGVVQELITGGADVNVQTAKGQTALSLAKNRRHSDIVDLLEKAGAKDPIR